jgi:XPG I-region
VVRRAGAVEDVERFSKRTVHMTKDHQEECKTLLRLMGVPVVEARVRVWGCGTGGICDHGAPLLQAPCEAEAQCAALCKAGKVYAVGTEDMDTLTFAAPVLVCGCARRRRRLPLCARLCSPVGASLQWGRRFAVATPDDVRGAEAPDSRVQSREGAGGPRADNAAGGQGRALAPLVCACVCVCVRVCVYACDLRVCWRVLCACARGRDRTCYRA